MKKPITQIDAVHQALEPYGFVDGKYGELPFTLRHTGFTHKLSPPGGGHYHVDIDGRTIAEVVPQRDGSYIVVMQLDVWLRGTKKMNPDMMAAVAHIMSSPLKQSLDYRTLSRKLIAVEKIDE